MNARQHQILKLLTDQGNCSVQDLSRSLKVSGVTIRQDLTFLENQGLLKRVHGGAILKDEDNLDIRMSHRFDLKAKIARRAAGFVEEGETILIESGSINALLARELVQKGMTNIITTNVYIARQFRNERNAHILLVGGIYQPVSESMVGKLARAGIDALHFSKAFIGIDGYSEETGFTSRDLLRAEISSHIIQKCEEVYIVSDSSKFGQKGLTTICQLSEVHCLVTDDGLPEPYSKKFIKEGIRVEMVPQGGE